MALPTKKTPPRANLGDYSILIYGPTKIGKTTLASQFPEALFLATEPGLNALEAYQIPITSWDGLLAAAAEIAGGNHRFKTTVIDTIDNAYKFCEEYICAKERVAHPSDMDYGKGFSLVNNEFQRVLTKLAALPYGLVMISHTKEIEVKRATGKFNKVTPTLPDKAGKIVLGMADMVLYCAAEESEQDGKTVVQRIIKTKPTPYYDAGDRTGRLPETLPLSYQAFHEAFLNAGKKAA